MPVSDSCTLTHTIFIHPAKEQPPDSAADKDQHILTTVTPDLATWLLSPLMMTATSDYQSKQKPSAFGTHDTYLSSWAQME